MSFRRVHSFLLLSGLLAVSAGQALAQAPASITGRITEAGSGQPIPAAQVSVLGTNIGAQTNSEGQYTIRGVPAGSVELRVLRVGYLEQRQRVTVTAEQTATADFQMRSAPVQLTAVVTTATGEQRQREVGNDIPHIDAATVTQTNAVTNVTDLL